MIVFPLIRSVRLKAATASSRAATLPMFVRSLGGEFPLYRERLDDDQFVYLEHAGVAFESATAIDLRAMALARWRCVRPTNGEQNLP
jgi:hypothetical protein